MATRQPAESYRHASASRKNLPTEQTEPLMSIDDKAPVPFSPELREDDRQPRLAWSRQPRLNDDEPRPHDAHPLYTREKIHPSLFVDQLRASREVQGIMREVFNGLPEGAEFDWYQHDGNWQNRLIHGESARVMASLAAREGLIGSVQMIYFDPPYGMGFKSNFQTSIDRLDTAENRRGLPSDPKTIAAFRDTYKRQIHSYLDGMLERLILCRELLAESGSIFVQIGDENVHRVALLLDEVFGAEHRVATIPYVTAGGSSARTLSSVADFLLWYAKDREQVKYHQLYEELDRAGKVEHMSSYAMVELADGTTRRLTADERADPDAHLPKGARLYRRMRLVSPGISTTGRSEPYRWKGQDWPCPPGMQWAVSMEGMDRLAELGRLDAASRDSELSWKRYEDEVPGRRIHNVWSRQMSVAGKRYVVQTANSVIERCMLMATDPGDLVLDPTCGGATTAHVAEQWGRRWITVDTSPVATMIARQRIVTATFPYYALIDANGRDPARGFVYESVPHVSTSALAYDEGRPATPLVDRPEIVRGVVRVSSPFTVESETPWSYIPFGDGVGQDVADETPAAEGDYAATVLDHITQSPIRGGRQGANIEVVDVTDWPGESSLVSHIVTYVTESAAPEREAALLIAAPDVIATRAMLTSAAADYARSAADGDDLLLLAVAYDFTPDCGGRFGRVRVVQVRPHRDLQIGDLKAEAKHQAFVMVGEPEIVLHDEGWDALVGRPRKSLEVLGYDTYNPATGAPGPADSAAGIACIMIDTDHDGLNFYVRRMHFPGADGDRQLERLAKQLGLKGTESDWQAALSKRSTPFTVPENGMVAVRIITADGGEMTAVRKIV